MTRFPHSALVLLLSLCLVFTPQAPASAATITIDSTLPAGQSVFGNGALPDGLGFSGDPNNNKVIVNSNGTVSGWIYGGYVRIDNATALTTVMATANEVIINDGTIGENIYGGYALSTNSNATVTYNTVNISDSMVGGDIYGGHAGTRETLNNLQFQRLLFFGKSVFQKLVLRGV